VKTNFKVELLNDSGIQWFYVRQVNNLIETWGSDNLREEWYKIQQQAGK
jgi:hypothetical protein